jgi:transcriptional regulator with PAS, ATPase and Fis domain
MERALQEREVRRVGENRPRPVDVRHEWPGSVREVQNAIEHAVAPCAGNRVDV